MMIIQDNQFRHLSQLPVDINDAAKSQKVFASTTSIVFQA
jgi:hypothetical protein